MIGRFQLHLPDFGKFERAAQVRPGTTTVDHGLHAETRVHVLPRIAANGGGRLCIEVTRCNLREQGCGGEQLHKRSPASVPDGHHSSCGKTFSVARLTEPARLLQSSSGLKGISDRTARM